MNAAPDVTPLLSIAIPTRNRSQYLVVLVRHLLRCERADFEVVIQDNSDDALVLQTQVQHWNDARVHYRHTPERLSIDANCDLAVAACRGDYICMLGDDDGLLLDESLAMLQAARDAGVDAIVPAALYYTWPSLRHKTWGEIGGQLFVDRYSGKVEALDAQAERAKVLDHGASLGLFQLPRVYQGFVKRTAMRALRARAQTCFPGPSPDMANSMGLTKVVERCVFVDFPYVIAGHSKGSGGGMGSEKQHQGDLANQAHLPAYTVPSWSPLVPFFWSGPTIYAQSALHAIDTVWQRDAFAFNHAYLYATCLVYERFFWRKTVAAMRAHPRWGATLVLRTAGCTMLIVARRARSFATNLLRYSRRGRAGVAAADIDQCIVAARSPDVALPTQQTVAHGFAR